MFNSFFKFDEDTFFDDNSRLLDLRRRLIEKRSIIENSPHASARKKALHELEKIVNEIRFLEVYGHK